MNKYYIRFAVLKTKRIFKVVLLFALLFGFTGTSVASTQAATPSAAADQEDGSIYDDEFRGSNNEINPRWQWVNENEERWRVDPSDGQLIIDGTIGDMFSTCNNPQNVLLQEVPDGNFEIVTKIELEPTENFQQGGLILMNTTDGQPDMDNYTKLDFVYSSFAGGLAIELVKENDGIFVEGDWRSREMPETNEIELKLIRSGEFTIGYYRTGGSEWLWLGMTRLELSSDAQMGLFALSGIRTYGEDPTCTPDFADIEVRFDYFQVFEGSVGEASAIFLPFTAQ